MAGYAPVNYGQPAYATTGYVPQPQMVTAQPAVQPAMATAPVVAAPVAQPVVAQPMVQPVYQALQVAQPAVSIVPAVSPMAAIAPTTVIFARRHRFRRAYY